MSNVWSEGLSKNNNFDKFECNFAYHQKMSGYAPDYPFKYRSVLDSLPTPITHT